MRNYRTTLTSISNADPAVFALTDHGLAIGDKIRLETTGTLPSPLAVKTDYYLVYNGYQTGAFQVSSTKEGTPIATTTDGSGTHYFYKRNIDGLIPRVENTR